MVVKRTSWGFSPLSSELKTAKPLAAVFEVKSGWPSNKLLGLLLHFHFSGPALVPPETHLAVKSAAEANVSL